MSVTSRSRNECSQETLATLIHQIYEAGLDPRMWTRFLESLSDAVHSGATSLIVHDHSCVTGEISVSIRMDPVFQRLYNEHYASVNIWKNNYATFYQGGSVINSSALCSDRVLEKSEFYADFLRPANLYYSAGPVIYREGPLSATLSTQRSKDKAPFEKEERIFHILGPHLERALRIQRTLGHAAASLEALDTVPFGIVLFGLNLKLLFVNKRAEAILDQADGLRLENGKVLAAVQSESRTLHRLLASFTRSARGLMHDAGGYLTVSRPSGGASLQVLISPVRLRFHFDPYAPAVLMIVGGGSERPINGSVLSELFHLTPREADLAAALSQGDDLWSAAMGLRISYETARWHLKSIFQKTGTHHQSGLVRLLLRSVASIALETRPELSPSEVDPRDRTPKP